MVHSVRIVLYPMNSRNGFRGDVNSAWL